MVHIKKKLKNKKTREKVCSYSVSLMVGRDRVSENKSLTELMRGEGETDRS